MIFMLSFMTFLKAVPKVAIILAHWKVSSNRCEPELFLQDFCIPAYFLLLQQAFVPSTPPYPLLIIINSAFATYITWVIIIGII